MITDLYTYVFLFFRIASIGPSPLPPASEETPERESLLYKIESAQFQSYDTDSYIVMRWRVCKLQDEGQSLMRGAMRLMNLSAHANHRILKLAHNR
jgi:predicted ATPase with chaperone activity